MVKTNKVIGFLPPDSVLSSIMKHDSRALDNFDLSTVQEQCDIQFDP